VCFAGVGSCRSPRRRVAELFLGRPELESIPQLCEGVRGVFSLVGHFWNARNVSESTILVETGGGGIESPTVAGDRRFRANCCLRRMLLTGRFAVD
jgi:hypothetical protein